MTPPSSSIEDFVEGNVDIQPYNTFKVPSRAKHFVRIRSIEDITNLIRTNLLKSHRFIVLGGGSNALFTQPSFDGVVIKNELAGISIPSEGETHAEIRASSGVNWNSLVEFSIANNLGGIENLILIPGTVGAAPVQNIGAYGVQISDVLVELEAVDLLTCHRHTFSKDECAFGYRESTFSNKKNLFITSITLKLIKAESHTLNINYGTVREYLESRSIVPTIRSVADAIANIRQSKLPDPITIPNCGSFFKNPTVTRELYAEMKGKYDDLISKPKYGDEEKLLVPAGWLIERCGWKGRVTGNVGVYKNNALVLVNHGGGNGEQIFELSQKIQQEVLNTFGVHLVPEITIVM